MSRTEKVRAFIAGCPFIDTLSKGVRIDWLSSEEEDYGIMPMGESIIRRSEDICGNVEVIKQYNYCLYARRFTVDDIIRLENSGFLEDFSDWIDEKEQDRDFPFLGDEPEEEHITAQNGMLFAMTPDGRTGRYQIQINHIYKKIIKQEEF